MKKLLFSGTSMIEIQGERVLRFIHQNKEFIEYEVIGFTQPKITIYDYRKRLFPILEQVLNSDNVEGFGESFNGTVDIKISQKVSKNENLFLQLKDTDIVSSKFMTWIVVGMENKIPIYQYILSEIEFLDNDKIAFFSLYERLVL